MLKITKKQATAILKQIAEPRLLCGLRDDGAMVQVFSGFESPQEFALLMVRLVHHYTVGVGCSEAEMWQLIERIRAAPPRLFEAATAVMDEDLDDGPAN